MATWNDLSAEQKATVANSLAAAREALGMSARWLSLADAIVTDWAAHIAPIVAAIGDGETIPLADLNAGQQPMLLGEIRAAVALMGQAVETFDTDSQRAIYIKAAGLYNTLQQGR